LQCKQRYLTCSIGHCILPFDLPLDKILQRILSTDEVVATDRRQKNAHTVTATHNPLNEWINNKRWSLLIQSIMLLVFFFCSWIMQQGLKARRMQKSTIQRLLGCWRLSSPKSKLSWDLKCDCINVFCEDKFAMLYFTVSGSQGPRRPPYHLSCETWISIVWNLRNGEEEAISVLEDCVVCELFLKTAESKFSRASQITYFKCCVNRLLWWNSTSML
jgi:hypothetical protein